MNVSYQLFIAWREISFSLLCPRLALKDSSGWQRTSVPAAEDLSRPTLSRLGDQGLSLDNAGSGWADIARSIKAADLEK